MSLPTQPMKKNRKKNFEKIFKVQNYFFKIYFIYFRKYQKCIGHPRKPIYRHFPRVSSPNMAFFRPVVFFASGGGPVCREGKISPNCIIIKIIFISKICSPCFKMGISHARTLWMIKRSYTLYLYLLSGCTFPRVLRSS